MMFTQLFDKSSHSVVIAIKNYECLLKLVSLTVLRVEKKFKPRPQNRILQVSLAGSLQNLRQTFPSFLYQKYGSQLPPPPPPFSLVLLNFAGIINHAEQV